MPAVTSEYKEGKLHGVVREYDAKGRKILRVETHYADGVKHGKMTVYDKRGRVIEVKTFEKGSEIDEKMRP